MNILSEIILNDYLIERVQLYEIEHTEHVDEEFIIMEVMEITDKTLFIRYKFNTDVSNYEDWKYSRLKYFEFKENINILRKIPRNSL